MLDNLNSNFESSKAQRPDANMRRYRSNLQALFLVHPAAFIQVAVDQKQEYCKLRSNGMPVPLLRNGYSIFNGTKYR